VTPERLYDLAQFNVAHMKAPLTDPLMKGFVDGLERINALAEAAPGFVWRLQDDAGDATAHRPLGEHTLVNLSVWSDALALKEYVYRSDHIDYLRARREWFEPMREAWAVMWWVPRGHRPSVAEAIERLEHLRAHGATPHAFTFSKDFAAPEASA
jgi:hypothetical protein